MNSTRISQISADHTHNNLLERQIATESNVRSYPRSFPLAIKKAKGCIITGSDGKEYYDCLSGAGTLALGHNHPAIVYAIQEAIAKDLPMHTLDITTSVKQMFIDEVLLSLPRYFSHDALVQFCGPTGADAVEAAIKLAKLITGRAGVFAFQGAYHGMTHGALSVTGNISVKENMPGLMPHVNFMPYPYAYRCPFGMGEAGAEIGLRYIENILTDPESGILKPAAMIVEVIQGEGGVIAAPNFWLQELRRITKQHDIILIIDEVQTGVGRTGDLYAFAASGIEPDILILSKAIGGGLPISLLVFSKDFDVWQKGHHTGTFRGNQLAMAAGIATLKTIQEEKILDNVQQMGARLKSHLEKIKKPYIAEIRGRGLMLAVEIVDKSKEPNHLNSYPPHPVFAREIQQTCFENGLIVELGGRMGSTLRFLSPLNVTDKEIDRIAEIFTKACP
jgi:diaminobutyrate-2-oxoglutarate transaminase